MNAGGLHPPTHTPSDCALGTIPGREEGLSCGPSSSALRAEGPQPGPVDGARPRRRRGAPRPGPLGFSSHI